MGGHKLGEKPSGKLKMCLKCEWHTDRAENSVLNEPTLLKSTPKGSGRDES